jgi:hypothetical protein
MEKLTTPQEIPIHLTELRLMAHVGPSLLDGLDLLDGYVQRIDLGEQKQWRSLQANGNLAPSILSLNEHGLRGFAACTVLRTDIVSRRK